MSKHLHLSLLLTQSVILIRHEVTFADSAIEMFPIGGYIEVEIKEDVAH